MSAKNDGPLGCLLNIMEVLTILIAITLIVLWILRWRGVIQFDNPAEFLWSFFKNMFSFTF